MAFISERMRSKYHSEFDERHKMLDFKNLFQDARILRMETQTVTLQQYLPFCTYPNILGKLLNSVRER